MLPLLDEELIQPGGSEAKFLVKMKDHHKENPIYKSHMKKPHLFVISHYAGEVPYDVTGFMEKNKDTLTDDVLEVLSASSVLLVQTLFPANNVSNAEKKASLGKQFHQQLQNLMMTLRLTEPHYIRCIKPNPDKAKQFFVPSMCNEQLTYSGVFEAVRIRKAGFPFRLKHDNFATRYAVLFDEGKAPTGAVKERCTAIVNHMSLDKENVRMGTSMVLYRAEEHKKLELHRNIRVRLQETNEDLARLTKLNPYTMNEGTRRHTLWSWQEQLELLMSFVFTPATL